MVQTVDGFNNSEPTICGFFLYIRVITFFGYTSIPLIKELLNEGSKFFPLKTVPKLWPGKLFKHNCSNCFHTLSMHIYFQIVI